MKNLSQILKPLESELNIFQVRFDHYLQTNNSLLNKIISYVLKQKGKRIRPSLVILSSQLVGGVNESTYRGAILVELLHTATLVHDDVVDDADMRRGLPSINALWKNKIAVLIGDYFLSRGLLLSLDHHEYRQLQILSSAVKAMSEGELLQVEKSRKLDITEDIYYKIIYAKTASLIASSTQIGGLSQNVTDEVLLQLKSIGENLGIAFQIRDDLFDYIQNNKDIGKPIGLDVKEKKLTLPLIFALRNSSEKEQSYIKKLISKPKKTKEFEIIKDFIHEKGGILYATQAAESYAEKALQSLNQFPESEAKTVFGEIIEFTVRRTS